MGSSNSSSNSQEQSVASEMLPFALYAAIPIIIAVVIAFSFGSLH